MCKELTTRLSSESFFRFIAAILLLFAISGQALAANPKYAGLVIDANTGRVLYEDRADQARYPASLTKMMTLYMIFDAIESGKISMDSRITISKYAASRPPSKIGFKPGQTITVRNAIYALVTKSANDVATAVGEFLGGSESNFAELMTRKARSLGMNATRFYNASGLPHDKQLTTARDMALLGIALREHFPHHYKYFSTRSFKYGKRSYRNHNRLLGQVKGVDGIKTGYTRASGFNLVTSVRSGKKSIVAVVMGGRSGKSRNAHMTALIHKYLPQASASPKQMLVGNVQSVPLSAYAPLPAKSVPTPIRRPEFPLEENKPSISKILEESQVRNDDRVDPVTTSATVPAGWVIQVGSLPSESQAGQFLEKTKSRAGPLLASANPFIETFSKGNEIFYRARFGGFEGKNDAWRICNKLKRKKISCFAIEN